MSDKTGRYSNALQCAALILKDEGEYKLLCRCSTAPRKLISRVAKLSGPMAFYKGFTMCFLRLWPHSIVSLLVFEQLRRGLGMAPI